MAVLVHRSLTNSQAIALTRSPPIGLARGFAMPSGVALFSRIGRTLRVWRRRMREREEMARLSDRELRDMRASHADVWRETNQWFWRVSRPF
ncbi:MAG TPA: DUF1127 domain-containing protein [Acetobacteraceae bacterium]|nr:DUF1127 domain-containing protein [Acetobacteraceae bacterium]